MIEIYMSIIRWQKNDYVIIPATICKINVLWDDVLFYELCNSTQAYSEPVKYYNRAFFSNS